MTSVADNTNAWILHVSTSPASRPRSKSIACLAPECHIHNLKVRREDPYSQMSVVSMPFDQVGIDIVGLLISASSKHKYILIDCATRYPEAFLLHNI